MPHFVSDFLQDRWPALPYTVPDGALELTTGERRAACRAAPCADLCARTAALCLAAFASRGVSKFCDLLASGRLAPDAQATVLQLSSARIATPEDSDGPEAWRLAGLSLELLEAGATREVRLRSALLLAQCLTGGAAVSRGVADGVPSRLVLALGKEEDADVRQVTVAALACLSSRAEGSVALTRQPETLASLVACIAKTPCALIPLADVAAVTAGATAALAAGAVPAVIAFLSGAEPAAAGAIVAVARDIQYPILRSRSAFDDALAVLRAIAEHDPGRDAIIAGGGTPVILRHAHAAKDARTLAVALLAIAALAGSVAGLASLLKTAGSSGAVAAVVAHLENADTRVSALAFVAAQALAVSPAGRQQLCGELVGRPQLLLRVFPPPAAAASAELVALLCAPATPPASVHAAVTLLRSIADPEYLIAGEAAAKNSLDAMARVSCTLKLKELASGPAGPGGSNSTAAAAKRLLELGAVSIPPPVSQRVPA